MHCHRWALDQERRPIAIYHPNALCFISATPSPSCQSRHHVWSPPALSHLVYVSVAVCPPTHTPPRSCTAGSGSSLPPTHCCTADRHSSVSRTHRLLHDSSRRLRFEQPFFPCIVTKITTTFQLFLLSPLPIATPAAGELDPARLSYYATTLLQSAPVGWSLETFRSWAATYTP